MNLPTPYENVMVTYKNNNGLTVTKEGFYCTLFKHFSMPPEWRTFNGKRLPHGWGGVHLKAETIIKWELIKQKALEQ